MILDLRIVPDVMTDTLLCTVAADASAADTARQMRDLEAPAALVLDADGGVLGVITDRDIVRRLVCEDADAATTSAADVMSPAPDWLASNDLAIDALDLMEIRQVQCLPVIDDGKVIGLVTVADVCGAFRYAMEKELEDGQRQTFRPETDE